MTTHTTATATQPAVRGYVPLDLRSPRIAAGDVDIGNSAPRPIRLTGHARGAEIRVHRGGVAALSAMFSRAYLDDLRRAHREGGTPTVDDPTRDA